MESSSTGKHPIFNNDTWLECEVCKKWRIVPQAVAERLGLISFAPVATALMQGSVQGHENGVSGEGVAAAPKGLLRLAVGLAAALGVLRR